MWFTNMLTQPPDVLSAPRLALPGVHASTISDASSPTEFQGGSAAVARSLGFGAGGAAGLLPVRFVDDVDKGGRGVYLGA